MSKSNKKSEKETLEFIEDKNKSDKKYKEYAEEGNKPKNRRPEPPEDKKKKKNDWYINAITDFLVLANCTNRRQET